LSETSTLAPAPPPRRLSSFVGRQAEIAELRRALATSRLVTLVGAGGCGKTRLALEVAAQVGPSFPAGVAFVELAPIQDPPLVPEAVAAALGIPRHAADRVADLVGGARLLLVLDNAEHLVEAVSTLVEELLAACPRLVVLATSRELLRVEGERCWRVPPMLLPPEAESADPAAVAGYDAVRLFCARSAEQQGDFRLAEGNAGLVAAICRRLDGMPLALELAAARVRSFALGEILRRLEDALGLLTRGPRDAVDRHRTLRATIEWSHQLLDAAERRLFRRLALFVGTFDLEAVEAICPSPDLPAAEVADVLHQLVDKSLVAVSSRDDGGLRYRLMEAVRQYAAERLEEAGEARLRAVHARWYAGLSARLAGDLLPLADRMETMSVEYDNVRLALDWAAASDPELAAELVVDVRWFWTVRGSLREARQAALAAAASGGLPPPLQAAVHREVVNWSIKTGYIREARIHAEAAVLLLEGIDDPVLEASALCARGGTRSFFCVDDGERDFERARALLESAGEPDVLARVLNNQALLQVSTGRTTDALATAERLVPMIAELRGRSSEVPLYLHTYGAVLLGADHADQARDVFLDSLCEAVQHGNYALAAIDLQGLACAAWAAGDAFACLLLAAAARRSAELGLVREFDEPGIAVAAAERASEAALSPRAAARAREAGAGMDPRAALEHVRTARTAARPAPLTPRKREIVRLVAEGLTNRAIADRLCISERTVDAHLEQVRNQLGLSNRAQLTAWAGRHLDEV
jgi:non-specific serine/threonine protein kinase